MNDVIIIRARSGSMAVNFSRRLIILNREGALAKAAGLCNMTILFDDITDIELKNPSFSSLGGCNIIVKNIRYVTSSQNDMTNFSVESKDFSTLEATLRRVLFECRLSGFKAVNSVPARKMEFTPVETNHTMSGNAQYSFNQKKEEAENENGSVDLTTEAKLFAQSVELQLLKAPASAKFCTLEEMTVTFLNGVFTVSGYVDSQNSYGAMIRTPFTLKVYRDATGWKSADKFESVESKVTKNIATNMIIFWIIGLIGAGAATLISFLVIYFVMYGAF